LKRLGADPERLERRLHRDLVRQSRTGVGGRPDWDTTVETVNTTATATAGAANEAVSTAATTAQNVSGTTTGSIGNAGPAFNAIVPSVVGAPGDGSVALSNAIQRQLRAKGVQLASVATSNTYRIEGRVKVGANKGGKQPISIDWHVKDPTGKQLGTVSQKNEIPAGSLDGTWGQTADAAAAAATHGIIELLPKKQQVANR